MWYNYIFIKFNFLNLYVLFNYDEGWSLIPTI